MYPEEVNFKNFSEYVSYLIIEFYKNNIDPYLNALDPNVVWVGASDGQLLHGYADIKKYFEREVNSLQFDVGPIYTEIIPHGTKCCDTLSFFARTSHHPDGSAVTLDLVYHLSWVKTDVWRMSVISIMNRTKRDSRDMIYPVHLTRTTYFSSDAEDSESERLLLREKGKENTILVSPEKIQWAESQGHYSIIHFKNYPLTVVTDIKGLAEKTKGVLLQCHASYLVNPYYVTSIKRFSLTLQNGKEIPIPEKKYTSFKKELEEFLTGN